MKFSRKHDTFSEWVAWHLPHDIAMWTYIRLVAHGTQGRYGQTIVPDVTAMEILKRWDEPNTLLPGQYTMSVKLAQPKATDSTGGENGRI